MTAPSRFDCLVVGTCVADILVRPLPLVAPIGAGRLFEVDPIEVTTGGVVSNTGIGLARLGHSVAAASLVGNDLWGGLIRERLAGEGLDTTAVETSTAHATSTTAVLIDPSSERSFAHHVGGCAAIDLAWIQRQLPMMARADWVVLGYAGLLPALEPDLAAAAAAIRGVGCRVALETAGSGGSMAHVGPALPYVDLFVPSLDEAVAQTGCRNPEEMIQTYRSHGATGVVGVKAGTQGTLLSPNVGELLAIPCLKPPGPVIDTTGAGDAFLAGLIAGLIRSMPPSEAGLLGAATAALCVTASGATAGLRSYEETLAHAIAVGRSQRAT
jgi:sugar/nucleoside kinase (ribokinase family)